MKNLPPRLLFLICAALMAFAVSCGSVADTVGVASHSYVEARVDAVAEAAGVVVGEPPPQADIPIWLQVLLAGLGVPVSIGVTNHMRDKRRRAQLEPTNLVEARTLGYLEPQPPKVTA